MSAFLPCKIRYGLLSVSLLACLLAVQSASAQNQFSNKQQSQNQGSGSGLNVTSVGPEHIRVVGHLPLENIHVNQMFVEERNSKTYLYLHRPNKDAYAVVDVTDPQHPKIVTRDTLKEPNAAKVEGPTTGSAFGIAVAPENSANEQTGPVTLPTETVQFIDLSDPKNAKSVKTFKGVTAMYPDTSRKLVFLVNNEGLWIINHHMDHPLPLCNSESALTPEPDCQ